MLFKKISTNLISLILIFSLSFTFLLTPQKTNAGFAGDAITGIAMCAGSLAAGVLTASLIEVVTGSTAGGTGTGMKVSVSGNVSDMASSLWKECVLDPTINAAKNALIAEMTESILGKTNTGRDGDATYVKNFDDFLKESYDQKVGEIIYNDKNLNFLCSDFELPLKFYLQATFYGSSGSSKSSKCSLSQIEQNVTNAATDTYNYYKMGNFYKVMVDSKNNNIFGVAFETDSNLRKAIGKENTKKMEDVTRNAGFISFKKCDSRKENTPATTEETACVKACTEKYGLVDKKNFEACETNCYTTTSFGLTSDSDKDHCDITTPGRLLFNASDKTLWGGMTGLQLADEFDEIFTALLGALITKAFSEDGLASADTLNYDNYNPSTDMMAQNILDSFQSDPEAELIEKGKLAQARLKVIEEAYNIMLGNSECWNEKVVGWGGIGNVIPKGNTIDSSSSTTGEVSGDGGAISGEIGTEILPAAYNVYDRLMESLRSEQAEKWAEGTVDTREIEKIYNIALDNVKAVQAELCLFDDEEFQQAKEEISNSKDISELFEFKNKYSKYMNTGENEQIAADMEGERQTLNTVLQKNNGLSDSYQVCKKFDKATTRLKEEVGEDHYSELFYNADTGLLMVSFTDIDSIEPQTDGEVLDKELLNTSEVEELEENCEYVEETGGNGGTEGNTGEEEQTDKDTAMQEFVDSIAAESMFSNDYESLITEEFSSADPRPSKAAFHKTAYGDFSEFILSEGLTKFPDGQKYLTWLKEVLDKNDELSSIYTISIPSNSYVDYNVETLGDVVDSFAGNGRYCTRGDWAHYKAFIPEIAKKYALLFKPQYSDSNILFRVHLTYQPSATDKNTIDHTSVLPLIYTGASDDTYSSLDDLFVNGKTVLLNINNDMLDLTSTRDNGVSTAGLILGETEINKYIQDGGGWLYIDIAQDIKATGSFSAQDRELSTLVYLDIDRDSQDYEDWINNYVNENNTFEDEPTAVSVKNRDCDEFKDMDKYVYEDGPSPDSSTGEISDSYLSSSSSDSSSADGEKTAKYTFDSSTYFVGDGDY